jgi:hypothetical protein
MTYKILSSKFRIFFYNLLGKSLDVILHSVHFNIVIYGTLLYCSCLWVEDSVLDDGLVRGSIGITP